MKHSELFQALVDCEVCYRKSFFKSKNKTETGEFQLCEICNKCLDGLKKLAEGVGK